ncbi:hypothetical protein [Halorarum halobium]|uniref:hypothetical protein n=1 Tax=Halorarum halobium TaxID=3075121 RepID=UPI0028A9AE6B|nr:hypothetical protein [Halobaculum sp. XH14]
MRPRALALSVLVLVALAVGAQLAFTDVGREIGGDWGEPTELATLDDGTTFGSVAAGGSVAPPGGAVAWVERTTDGDRLRVARLAAENGQLAVEDAATVATLAEAPEVDVARTGERVAVTWIDREADAVRLWTDGAGTRTVSAPDTARVASVDVATLPNRTVLAWRAYEDGSYRVRLGLVGPDGVERRTLDAVATGRNSPAIAAGPAGERVALAWVNDDGNATVAVGPPTGSFDPERLGDARGGSGGIGGGPPAAIDVGFGDRVVGVWSDLGVVHAGPVGTEPTRLGSGRTPRVAAGEDRWLATQVVRDRSSANDLAYVIRGGGATGSGSVSRLPSNALQGAPLFAPDPAVAWVERGGTNRLLASAYTGTGPTGPVERLTAGATRFGFVALAAGLAATVTVPLLPWVAGPLVVGFLLTTRTALSAVARLASVLLGRFGGEASAGTVRTRLRDAPPWVGFGLFVLANLAVYLRLGKQGVLPGGTAPPPLGVSALALVGTAVLSRLLRADSAWRLSFLFGYCQSLVLWSVALPSFL